MMKAIRCDYHVFSVVNELKSKKEIGGPVCTKIEEGDIYPLMTTDERPPRINPEIGTM